MLKRVTEFHASQNPSHVHFLPSPQAYVVLGQYLLLKKNDELFCNWLKETCGANKKQQADCAKCLKEWWDSFMTD